MPTFDAGFLIGRSHGPYDPGDLLLGPREQEIGVGVDTIRIVWSWEEVERSIWIEADVITEEDRRVCKGNINLISKRLLTSSLPA